MREKRNIGEERFFAVSDMSVASALALLSTYKNGSDDAYEYAYDDNGNITSITRGSTSVTYQYNGANELIRENNGFTQPHDYLHQ